jgi:hypothetical protein
MSAIHRAQSEILYRAVLPTLFSEISSAISRYQALWPVFQSELIWYYGLYKQSVGHRGRGISR